MEEDKVPLNFQVEYWIKRPEQTLQHTQIATRQIYLVDAGVLAFLYFLVGALGTNRGIILFAAIPVALLAAINYLHSQWLGRQHSWYNGIDKRLRELLNQTEVDHQYPASHWWQPKTSHDAHIYIHKVIMLAMVIVTIVMLLYGFGCIPEIRLVAS